MTAADPREAARSGATFAAIPFVGLMGLRREMAQGGQARVVADDDPQRHDSRACLGAAALLALMDTAMASAAISCVDFAFTAVTLDLNASFIHARPGPLQADARVVARDDRLLFCEAEVTDTTGAAVARGRGCFRLLPHPSEGDKKT